MHLVLDLPDQKPLLDTTIAKQFDEIRQQLMGLLKAKPPPSSDLKDELLGALRQQQQGFITAVEKLVESVQQAIRSNQSSDTLVDAVRDLRHVMVGLPDDLKGMMGKMSHEPSSNTLPAPVSPKVTVQVPSGFMDRIDSLESALLDGLRRSRNRTFGSNY